MTKCWAGRTRLLHSVYLAGCGKLAVWLGLLSGLLLKSDLLLTLTPHSLPRSHGAREVARTKASTRFWYSRDKPHQ